MNKVITINLNGVAYQLEEAGYHALRDYLDEAERHLEANPDKDEILADIEQAIGDKLRVLLGAHKNVVSTREIDGVIAEMGPVRDADAEASGANEPEAETLAGEPRKADAPGEDKPYRRIYRVYDGAKISGVCNGLGIYFGIDPTILRIAFVLLTLVWGAGILAYFLMVLLIPVARTPQEKAAASGPTATAQEFVRRAKAGYYEGVRLRHDKQAHREWKRKFKQEMRTWTRALKREVHENAHRWRQNWEQENFPFVPAAIAAGFTVLLVALFAFGLYTIVSLVMHGQVFGLALPAGIPLWIGIVAAIIFFQVLSWPLRAARHACYFKASDRHAYVVRMGGPLDGIFGLVFVGILIWLADHYSPSFHEWLMQLGLVLHRTVDSIKAWWNGGA